MAAGRSCALPSIWIVCRKGEQLRLEDRYKRPAPGFLLQGLRPTADVSVTRLSSASLSPRENCRHASRRLKSMREAWGTYHRHRGSGIKGPCPPCPQPWSPYRLGIQWEPPVSIHLARSSAPRIGTLCRNQAGHAVRLSSSGSAGHPHSSSGLWGPCTGSDSPVPRKGAADLGSCDPLGFESLVTLCRVPMFFALRKYSLPPVCVSSSFHTAPSGRVWGRRRVLITFSVRRERHRARRRRLLWVVVPPPPGMVLGDDGGLVLHWEVGFGTLVTRLDAEVSRACRG